ncbi:unnamed protein product [Effrenium voratum]|nr:unnamed protein product [Effrenium voratum]
MARRLLKKAILAGGVRNEKEMEIAAGGFGAKMKLLAVIGADLVGKAVALRDVVPIDEFDALMVAGVILMVIGAVWVAKQAVCATVGCAKKLRRIQVEERPRDFIQVDREIAELRDQWGRRWVVQKEKGLEQEHHWTANGYMVRVVSSLLPREHWLHLPVDSNLWNLMEQVSQVLRPRPQWTSSTSMANIR